MTKDTYFSRRCIPAKAPKRERCSWCGEILFPGSSVYQFARIDPKNVAIEYAYTHISCSDKRAMKQSEAGDWPTDEQIKRIWTGIEELQRRRAA